MEQRHYLDDLDDCIGPAAVLSLSERDLIPTPGAGVSTGTSPEIADRILGALVGSAIGSALGFPHEWRRPPTIASIDLLNPSVPAAEITLLQWSIEAQLDNDLSASSGLAERLRDAPPLIRPGNAVPAAIRALGKGVPWFEAGVGSLGSGASVRAVGAGLVLRDRPEWRTVLAGLDTTVTHASANATSVAAAVAEIVATLLALRPDESDTLSVLDRVVAALGAGAASEVVRSSRRRLAAGHVPARSGPTAIDALGAAIGHAFASLRDPELVLRNAVAAGGDTDTVAALVGAFVGAANGTAAFPSRWRAQLGELARLEALASRCAGAATSMGSQRDNEVLTAGNDSGAVHISLLLDRSGSMEALRSDVVGGVNVLLAQHRAERDAAGACRITIAQFDSGDPFEILVENQDIGSVADIDQRRYIPRGTTPLYDAIACMLDHAEARLAERVARGADADDQLVVVFTDGLENASTRTTRSEVFSRISGLKARGWTFVFLGANQDSYAEGGAMGVAAGNVSNYAATPTGARSAWASVHRSSLEYRRKGRARRRADIEDFFAGVKEGERGPSAPRRGPGQSE